MESQFKPWRAIQNALFSPWGALPVPLVPPYASQLGDDHSPYEYSLAFTRNSIELRILCEAQAQAPSLVANQAAALELNRSLAERFRADMSRFDVVRDLFLPERPQPPFSLWHAVSLSALSPPAFKVYLNPAAQGAGNAVSLGIEALGRLGFATPERIFERLMPRGEELDEFRYFSLDLSADAHARIKLYFAHHQATSSQLEASFRNASLHRSGDVNDFLDAVAGGRGPFLGKPVTSCFSFVSASSDPSAVTCHFPVAHYSRDDQETGSRVSRYLESQEIDSAVYQRALSSFSGRSLESGLGFQSYASYRRERTGVRVTAYVSPELFRKGRAPELVAV